ncbi:MAG: hypothetical protein CMG87_01235 [Marinobacter sp.]|nr:hypothetical protein [Marinobacter sp.]|tara:strand:- start:593 stop:919 length:327 start_codon:yes stop_codon:yes gene_type:complete
MPLLAHVIDICCQNQGTRKGEDMRELPAQNLIDRLLNALLLYLISILFWSWLGEMTGLPVSILLGVGAILMSSDLKDFSGDPRPGALVVGAALLPAWPLVRCWLKGPG